MKPKKPTSAPNPQIQEAVALHLSGQLTEAVEQMRKLLTFYPKNAQLLTHLGTIYLQQGQTEMGISALGKSIQIDPCQPMALFNRANGLTLLGKWEEALNSYNKTVALQPNHAEALNSLGNLLIQLNRNQEALASYDRVISLKPDLAGAYHNRGLALQRLRRFEEALASYDKVIVLEPNRAEALNNRGNVLRKLNRLEEALVSYDKAIAIKSDYAEAHNNRGTVLQELKRLDEAIGAHERAIALKADYREAYFNLALLKLLKGNYLEGWKLYQWRENQRKFTQPLWTGAEPLEGKTILVYTEHGYGDVIQFCRYAKLIEKQGAKVIFEVPVSLEGMVSSLGSLTVIGVGQPLPAFDFYCAMMSLPLIFQTTVETIPAEIPYLFSDKDKKAEWNKKLGPKTLPRVGVVWSGNPEHTNDHNRSIPLETLKPLLELPFEFHSLQKDYKGKDGGFLLNSPQLKNHQIELTDFSETAALMDEMDLIITVDTSAAHLAGALGKPVWVLLPFVPDYRWLLERNDSPWYSTATLFRQSKTGDWKTTVAEVIKKLSSELR
jgi:tetratricopeptide (TPR) repeat protein